MVREATGDGSRSAANDLTVLGVLGIVAVLGVAVGVVSRQSASPGTTASLATVGVDRSSLPVTVPLRRHGGHVLVDVSFGPSNASLPLLLDTGAPTSIPAWLAAALGAEPAGRARLAPLSGSPLDVDVVRIPELRIGGARFIDVPAIVAVPPPGSPLADIAGNGIVGSDLVAAAVWQIDYPAAQLTIATDARGLVDLDDGATLPARAASSHSPSPVVDLVIDGETIPVLVDTGSDAGLLLHPRLLRKPGSGGPRRRVTVDGWDRSRPVTTWSTLAEVQVQPGLVQRHLIELTTALPSGTAIMGNAFLAGHVVTIDLPAQEIGLFPGLETVSRTGDPAGRGSR